MLFCSSILGTGTRSPRDPVHAAAKRIPRPDLSQFPQRFGLHILRENQSRSAPAELDLARSQEASFPAFGPFLDAATCSIHLQHSKYTYHPHM